MQHHVFLSYSHKDADLMQRVCDDLRAVRLTVWTDEGIEPGTSSWKKAIQEAIENAGCLVVILSPDAKQSEWVERELDYASAQKVRIFPLLARGDERDAIPFALSGSQFIDMRFAYASGLHNLTAVLRDHLGLNPETPARTPTLSPHFTPPSSEGRGLEAWNFFDQMRLLWWLFWTPSRVRTDEINPYTLNVQQTAAWIISTMAWSPFFASAVGYALGTVQVTATKGANVSVVVAGLLCLFGWFITAWIGWHHNRVAGILLLITMSSLSFLIFVLVSGVGGITFTTSGGRVGTAVLLTTCISLGVAAGLALRLANSAVGALAGIVIGTIILTTLAKIQFGVDGSIAGLVMIAVAFAVSSAIETNLLRGVRSRRSMFMFTVMTVNFAVMIWLYFLGGWQALAA
jgi:hypothetical protein